MATDISERGFESIIVNCLIEGNGYESGDNAEYNKNYAMDIGRLFRYLKNTQSELLRDLRVTDSPAEQTKFIDALDKQLSREGIIKLLRDGFTYKRGRVIQLYQATASKGNETAAKMYAQNIFSVTRQLRYSKEHSQKSVDVVIFLNGLPLITMELKNNLSRQCTADAVEQYKKDRSPHEKIFNFKRCLVHFAVDDETIMMCTQLAGKESYFIPFNKGNNDGAGNPVNDSGIKTDYLWKIFLTKAMLTNILENYAQVETKNGKEKQIFPRYHQIKAVSKLLKMASRDGVGKRYLIQHSAGSGKSYSIAWLAHQLADLRGRGGKNIFDIVMVVTDRIILDDQIKKTVKQFTQMDSTVGWASSSTNLRKLLSAGKNIIVTTIHKFHAIVDKIDTSYGNKNFAIIIDEAHSSQSGTLAANMNQVVSGSVYADSDDLEDKINALIEGKRAAKNASYFAFTATPKNKTLELFGKVVTDANGKTILNEDGTRRAEPHDVYTMKQAIEEGFILDVLRNYTPYRSYYRLVKIVDGEKYFKTYNANNILRQHADNTELVIKTKAGIIVEHFYNNVRMKIDKQARAMVVTGGIHSAIEYYFAITAELEARNSQYKAVIAFSGESEYHGKIYNEATLNGFPSANISKKFREEPYRIMVVADKFQTGYDEPLLQAMYVDKRLFDIKAVQTLSRLNRTAAHKHDTCIIDFVNEAADITNAFNRYYKTTILSGETDPSKLNDLFEKLLRMNIFASADVDNVVEIYLSSESRERLDPILNRCVKKFCKLNISAQIEFKRSARTFINSYGFLSAIIPYSSVAFEKLSIFLNLLMMKLPRIDTEPTEKITEYVAIDEYKTIAQDSLSIAMENENGEVNSISVTAENKSASEEVDTLTHILREFHKKFGYFEWAIDADAHIASIWKYVQNDARVNNAVAESDSQNIHTEINRAVAEAIGRTGDLDMYVAYLNGTKNKFNVSFKAWLDNIIYQSLSKIVAVFKK